MQAQTTSGTFGGTVSDATGGRVVQAAVTALNVETGQKFKAVTSGTGDFIIVQVPPGNYEVDVVAKGFKTLSRKGLIMEVAGKVTLDLSLEVGSITESVSVTGEAPLLRTQDAQVGDIIDSLAVQNVPQLDRDPLNLLRLSGDISGDANANSPAGSAGSNVRINGGRQQGMDVLVDGNSMMSGKFHAVYAAGTPTMEQVDEFKVVTNGIPAEYGRVSGGLVTVVTKGGTNEFHGQGFEYFKNQLLDANSWEQNNESPYVPGQKAPRAKFKNNDYGGMLSGPVIIPKIYNGKNKTFWFFNFEGLKNRQAGSTVLARAATDADKNGNLTGLLSGGSPPQMYDPLGDTTVDPSTGYLLKATLFPENGQVIPAARINPLATLIDNFAPAPNNPHAPGWTQQAAWLGFAASKTNDAHWETRLDHNLTDNSRLTLRFFRDNYDMANGNYYSALSPGNQQIRNGALTGSLGWTWAATPTTIVELRGSVMHNPNPSKYAFPTDSGTWPIDPLIKTLTQGYPNAMDYRVWSSNQDGWGDPVGNQQSGGQDVQSNDTQTTYDFVLSVSKIWQRHTFKAGFDHRRLYDNHFELLYSDLMYQGWATDRTDDNRDGTTTGDPSNPSWAANTWGDWLLGMPNNGNQGTLMTMANEQNYYAAYIQDDFKVNKRLTLNLGLRWDEETPATERHNYSFAWNPDAPSQWYIPAGYSWTGSLQAAGLTADQIAMLPVPSWVTNGKFPNGAACYQVTTQCPSRDSFKYHPWNFAPRLGAAYQLNSKTVLRASWGMMYLTATGDYWQDWVAAVSTAAMPSVPDRVGGGINGQMLHTDQSIFLPSQYVEFQKTQAHLNQTMGNFWAGGGNDINSHPPLEQNWNAQVQRQLPWNVLLEVGYAGNHSGDLLADTQQYPYPTSALNPALNNLYKIQVANPLANQIQNTAPNVTTGPTVPLGDLMLANPAWGGLMVGTENIGRANYNAGSVKLQKRLSQGVTFLATYTYSKSMDDVGSINGWGSSKPGSKAYQCFQTINNLYGYSPDDMTHRFTFYHDYQFPFGKGRQFLGRPNGVGGKILDGIVGGWQYAGIWIYHSGRPLTFSTQLADPTSSGNGVGTLWGSISGDLTNIKPSNWSGNYSSLLTATNLTDTGTWGNLGSATVRAFDETRFSAPQALTPGNLPNIYPYIREPGANSYDASLMKNFSIAREGKVYLQLRVEAQNALNIRGLGGIDTLVGSPTFGLITASAQDPRQMQISGRIVF